MNLIDSLFMPFGVNIAHARRQVADRAIMTDEARGPSSPLSADPIFPEPSTLPSAANPVR